MMTLRGIIHKSGTKRTFCVFILVLFYVFCLCDVCLSARGRSRTHASKGCEFPSRWTGTWFQKGVHPPIKVEKDVFSSKGKCIDADGHMFFIENTRDKCFRCVVIYEKHPNVLQYRETYCYSYSSLRQACGTLNADAPLHSMFRANAEPVSCQLRGPFTFTYSRGGGECKYPVSTIDSCTDDSRLLFRFQACADVMGTESSVEELSCLAVWKEGSAHYLVGKMSNKKRHNLPFTDENSYRCFVFDYLQEKKEIQMSQSSDATCDGLVTPWEGSRTMRLIKSEHPVSRCQFPGFTTTHRRWHTLDGKKTYVFSHRNTSFKIHLHDGSSDTTFICADDVSYSANTTTVVAHGLSGCENGFVCMTFFKRHDHIIEIQMGGFSRTSSDACQPPHSESTKNEYVTLVAGMNLPSSGCPQLVSTSGLGVHLGKAGYGPTDVCRGTSTMVVGCRSNDRIEFLTTCATFADVKSFHCHGHWEENGRGYLVTGLSNSRSKYCFVYWSNDKTTHLTGVHDTCRRNVEASSAGNFTFNISSTGHCEGLLSANSTSRHSPWTLHIIIAALGLYIWFSTR